MKISVDESMVDPKTPPDPSPPVTPTVFNSNNFTVPSRSAGPGHSVGTGEVASNLQSQVPTCKPQSQPKLRPRYDYRSQTSLSDKSVGQNGECEAGQSRGARTKKSPWRLPMTMPIMMLMMMPMMMLLRSTCCMLATRSTLSTRSVLGMGDKFPAIEGLRALALAPGKWHLIPSPNYKAVICLVHFYMIALPDAIKIKDLGWNVTLPPDLQDTGWNVTLPPDLQNMWVNLLKEVMKMQEFLFWRPAKLPVQLMILFLLLLSTICDTVFTLLNLLVKYCRASLALYLARISMPHLLPYDPKEDLDVASPNLSPSWSVHKESGDFCA